MKYGARYLKRTIERLVVHPLSNLIAMEQVSAGDWVELDFDTQRQALTFEKIGERCAGSSAGSVGENVADWLTAIRQMTTHRSSSGGASNAAST